MKVLVYRRLLDEFHSTLFWVPFLFPLTNSSYLTNLPSYRSSWTTCVLQNAASHMEVTE